MSKKPLCKDCLQHVSRPDPNDNGLTEKCLVTGKRWHYKFVCWTCSLPEPFCYAPEMVKEIERLKAELATLIEQSKKDENEIQAREDYILKLKTELESALKPAREVAGEVAELQETLDKSHKDVTKGDN